MNIVHVYKDYFPVLGGIENHIRSLAEGQAARGHQVTVLATHSGLRGAVNILNGVRVIKAGRLATVASTPLSLTLPLALRSLRPDITHLHAPYPMGELAQMLAGAGRPYVVTYHADATRPVQRAVLRLYGPLLRRLLRRAARVLATSAIYAAGSPYLTAASDHTTVVPYGVDGTRFKPPVRVQTTAVPGCTLLFVGLLRHYKGVDVLLRAMPYLPPDTRLIVAGDGPMRAQLEALCDRLGLRERVEFLGRVAEDLPAVYQQADIFVLPSVSRAEALGLVLVEAMLTGLPCVTTEIGTGTSYVVQDGFSGFVVQPGDPQALAEAIARLVDQPDLRSRMGAAGRSRALQEFTVDRMLDQVEAIYDTALAETTSQLPGMRDTR